MVLDVFVIAPIALHRSYYKYICVYKSKHSVHTQRFFRLFQCIIYEEGTEPVPVTSS